MTSPTGNGVFSAKLTLMPQGQGGNVVNLIALDQGLPFLVGSSKRDLLLHSTLRIPHSALRTPHSAFRTPHSAFRIYLPFSSSA